MASNFKLKRIRDSKEFELSEISLLIGRSDSCDIKVTEGYPSREHARVAERDGAVLIQDLHSTNGTFVNNKRIEAAAVMHVGDVLKVGDEAFSLQPLVDAEATVLMRSLGMHANQNATVIDDDDEEDEDSTAFLEVYALPPGWDEGDSFSRQVRELDPRKKEAIDRYVDKLSKALKGKTGIMLIFFSDENPPVLKNAIAAAGKSTWTVGRAADCDIAFENPGISKHHATLEYSTTGWVLRDNDSKNGVALEGARQRSIELQDGMVVEISPVEVLIRFIR